MEDQKDQEEANETFVANDTDHELQISTSTNILTPLAQLVPQTPPPTTTTTTTPAQQQQQQRQLHQQALTKHINDQLSNIGLKLSPILSKEVIQAQNNKIKIITSWDQPKLTNDSTDSEFTKFLESLNSILSLIGLKSITLLDKSIKPGTPDSMNKIHTAAQAFVEYEYLTHAIAGGQDALVDELTSPDMLQVVIWSTLDVFPQLEEHMYHKLTTGLKENFNYIIPDSFYTGALITVYISIQREFRRPHTGAAFREYDLFNEPGHFKLQMGEDPRKLAQKISNEAKVINQIFNKDIITDFIKASKLRNAVIHIDDYKEKIKRCDEKRGKTDFNSTVTLLEDEYINYQKSTKSRFEGNNASASHKTPPSHSSKSIDDGNVHGDYDHNAMWVEVPKGHCMQYAIKGRCTRDQCEYKHVPGKQVDTPPERKRKLTRNENKFTNRFTPNNSNKIKPKNYKLNKAKKINRQMEKLSANLVKLLESSDSSPGTVSSDDTNIPLSDASDSQPSAEEKAEAEAFLTALKANMGTKSKSFNKVRKVWKRFRPKNKKKTNYQSQYTPRHPKHHPNKLSYNDKMKQLQHKEKERKRASKAALIASMLNDRRFTLESDDSDDADISE